MYTWGKLMWGCEIYHVLGEWEDERKQYLLFSSFSATQGKIIKSTERFELEITGWGSGIKQIMLLKSYKSLVRVAHSDPPQARTDHGSNAHHFWQMAAAGGKQLSPIEYCLPAGPYNTQVQALTLVAFSLPQSITFSAVFVGSAHFCAQFF